MGKLFTKRLQMFPWWPPVKVNDSNTETLEIEIKKKSIICPYFFQGEKIFQNLSVATRLRTSLLPSSIELLTYKFILKDAQIYFSNSLISFLGLPYFTPIGCSLRFNFFGTSVGPLTLLHPKGSMGPLDCQRKFEPQRSPKGGKIGQAQKGNT